MSAVMEEVVEARQSARLSWGDKYRGGLRFGVGNSVGMNALLKHINRIAFFCNLLLYKKDLPPLSLEDARLLEFGCGPGRDFFVRDPETGKLVRAFGYALGVDSEVDTAVLRTDPDIKDLMQQGKISVHMGTLSSVPTPTADHLFDVAHTHRVMHLLPPHERDESYARLFNLVRAGGIISVAARSPQDFKSETMRWSRRGKSEVIFKNGDRQGERMWLLTANQLGEELRRAGFQVVETYDAAEPENNFTPNVMTHCSGVIAMKPC